MRLSFFTLLSLFLFLALPFFLVKSFFHFSLGKFIFCILLLFCFGLLDEVIEAGLRAGSFDLKPVIHYGIFQLKRKLSPLLLLFVVLIYFASFLVFFEVLLAVWVFDDVVKCWFSHCRSYDVKLFLFQALVQVEVSVSEVGHGGEAHDVDIHS